MTVRAVFFDVGETLIDETRLWGEWADWLSVPRLTFFAALGAVIARGEDHGRVFEIFHPGFDLESERARRNAEGHADVLRQDDLYPDALACLWTLRDRGYRLGIAANQAAGVCETLRTWGLPVDVIATSARWGVEKPSAAFFARVIDVAEASPTEIAYVGDRVDNDVAPAAAAGIRAVFVRRGPWGYLQADWPDADLAALRIDTLADLPDGLRGL